MENRALSLAARLMEYRDNPHHINPMSDGFKKLCEEAAKELARLHRLTAA
jgi:hypothetical protein